MLPSPQFPRSRSFAPLAFLGTLILALMWVSPGRAVDGRDFAGFYRVSNVIELGDTVRLTLTVRVFNYCDADVNAATITVQDSTDPATTYGAYAGSVSVRDHESVGLSAEFTISQQEYSGWQNAGTPALRIEYRDTAGNPVRRMVELAQGLLEEE